jgi:hypothetical protein
MKLFKMCSRVFCTVIIRCKETFWSPGISQKDGIKFLVGIKQVSLTYDIQRKEDNRWPKQGIELIPPRRKKAGNEVDGGYVWHEQWWVSSVDIVRCNWYKRTVQFSRPTLHALNCKHDRYTVNYMFRHCLVPSSGSYISFKVVSFELVRNVRA